MNLPWTKKQRESLVVQDQRASNSEAENEILTVAQERWRTAYTEKTRFDGTHLHSLWRDFDRMYRGEQWMESVPEGKSTPVINLVLAMIQAVLPRITDSYPEFMILPRRTSRSSDLAKQLTSVVDYLWYHNKMQERKIGEATLHMLKYGTSIIKTTWDASKWDGLGEVAFNVVHPMNFFPDPRAYTIEDMDYCFTSVPKPLEYFLRRWPEKGKLVIPDLQWVDTEALEKRDQPSKESVAALKEYWYRNEAGNVCVMYYAGDVVLDVFGGELDDLMDSDEPVYRHNRWPFAKFVDYAGDKEFWGFGEIELSEILQRLINTFEAQIIDNTRLMANAQWVVNKVQSGLDEQDAWIFDNTPGKALFTHNDGVRKEPGVPIPAHIPQHQENLIFMLEQVLGIHDVVQGRRPVGVRAASAIIALQEAANTRVRQKSKHLGDAIREMVEQAIELVMEFYDEPRQVRLAGEMVPTTMNIQEALVEDVMGQAMEAGEVQFDQNMEVPQEERDRIVGEYAFPQFDVEIKVGPSLPYSQALLYEQAKEFYQLGIIDREAVLEATNFPDKEKILKRMEMKEQQMAQMEQQQAGGERTF